MSERQRGAEERRAAAWIVADPGPLSAGPLHRVTRPLPDPGPGELRVRVSCCGVCRTDLHVAEGDLPVRRPGVVPGHEVVGVVDGVGPRTRRFSLGDRVGVAWLASTCGVCRFCRYGDENLCEAARFTGWDRDGGYAEVLLADERFAYRIPPELRDAQAAPLLCAGIIGYRALKRTGLVPGGTLGIWGFGGSAHLTAQLALAQGAQVHVRTRSSEAQRLALDLGATSAGDSDLAVPVPLDGAILFAPAGELVPVALGALGPGAALVVAGIHLSRIPQLDYRAHLFEERDLRSVTANTRADGEEYLRLAGRLGIRSTVREYPLEEAPFALADLAADRVTGAAVLRVAPEAR